MTKEQQEKAAANMGLVHKVIRDRLHPPYQAGLYSYEDLVQIGSIGLCKAAATDRGGTFSTYAYRLIWNEICDALAYATRRQARETLCDVTPFVPAEQEISAAQTDQKVDIERMLACAKADAPPSTAKGIEAMQMMSNGYTSREIGERMGASDKLVCAWVSKARKFLKSQPQAQKMAAAYHIGL